MPVPNLNMQKKLRDVCQRTRDPAVLTGCAIPLAERRHPRAPGAPGVPRGWMVGVIRQTARAVERRKASSAERGLMYEFLTGHPPGASESHKGWFLEGMGKGSGNLSNGQVWVLSVLVTADQTRGQEGTGLDLLPLADSCVLRQAWWALWPPAKLDEVEESAWALEFEERIGECPSAQFAARRCSLSDRVDGAKSQG